MQKLNSAVYTRGGGRGSTSDCFFRLFFLHWLLRLSFKCVFEQFFQLVFQHLFQNIEWNIINTQTCDFNHNFNVLLVNVLRLTSPPPPPWTNNSVHYWISKKYYLKISTKKRKKDKLNTLSRKPTQTKFHLGFWESVKNYDNRMHFSNGNKCFKKWLFER